MTEAWYIAEITRSRGWDLEFVRWQLPPGQGLAFMHADMLASGKDVVWADRDSDPDVIAFRKARDEILAKYSGGAN